MMRLLCLVAGLLFTLPIGLPAQVSVRAELVDGSTLQGRLISGNLDEMLIGEDAASAKRVATTGIYSLRPTHAEKQLVPAFSNSSWIILSTGERLRAQPTVITDETLTAQWMHFRVLPPVQIPLDACLACGLSLPSDPVRLGIELNRLMSRSEDSDQLTLRNSDSITGEFKGLADLKFEMHTSLGKVATDLPAVQSLAFNPSLVTRAKSATKYASLVLTDGSILRLTELRISGESVFVKSQSGISIELATTMISDLMVVGGERESLVDQKPEKVETTPFLTTRRDPRWNSNVLGGPLFIGGIPFATGIGVTSGTSLSWSLNRDYSAFQASVGLDDAAGMAGAVEFEVLVDGQSIWRSGLLQGTQPALKTPIIDLSGKSQLTLRTTGSGALPIKCWANWCQPALVRRGRLR